MEQERIKFENGDEIIFDITQQVNSRTKVKINYSNGDLYDGEFEQKQKNGKGVYMFNPENLDLSRSDINSFEDHKDPKSYHQKGIRNNFRII
jgi:hypothetical protein